MFRNNLIIYQAGKKLGVFFLFEGACNKTESVVVALIYNCGFIKRHLNCQHQGDIEHWGIAVSANSLRIKFLVRHELLVIRTSVRQV